MQETTGKRVLAAVPDLFFGSKISGTASRLGVSVQFAASRKALLDGVRSEPDLIVVDLEAAAVDPLGAVREIRALKLAREPRLIAFGSHIYEALLREARDAGYDEVLTKGSLAATLPELLGSL